MTRNMKKLNLVLCPLSFEEPSTRLPIQSSKGQIQSTKPQARFTFLSKLVSASLKMR